MGFQGFMAITSLIFSVAAADRSHKAQKAAARETAEFRRKQENLEKARDAQARRSKIREERVRRAQVMQRSEVLGVGGSSGELGAIGSLSTQTGSAIGFQTGQRLGAQSASQNLQSAAGYTADASTWSAYSSVGMSTFNKVGGFGSFDFFKSDSTK